MGGVDAAGTFDGDSLMTRAQACTILLGLDNYIAEHGSGETEDPEPPTETEQPQQPADGERSPFAFQDGENVQQMMNRLNAEAPAYTPGYLTNGKPITEENIKEMLAEAQESMPEGTPWATGSTYYYSTGVFADAGYPLVGGCESFAAALSDYIFGKGAPSTMHQNFDQLKVGDVVWMKDSSTGEDHCVLVTGFGDGYFKVTNGSSSSTVQWGAGMNVSRWSETKKAETYVFSRY